MGKRTVANPESIVVLYGGVGPEREVSLVSGQAIAEALSEQFAVELLRIDCETLRSNRRTAGTANTMESKKTQTTQS